jgi:hypothetical protein
MNGCTLSGNSGWGLVAEIENGEYSVEVWNNVVESNGSGGLSVGQFATVGVVSNTISWNGGYGLYLWLVWDGWANVSGWESASGITGNVISSNWNAGVMVQQSGPQIGLTINTNDIFDNGSYEEGYYELCNDSGSTVVANDNYWGEPTTTEFYAGQANLSRIYDWHDNSAYGQVQITSIRGTPAALSAPPSFTTEPQSVLAMSGSNVVLWAVATGSGITFQWYLNGNSVTNATNTDLSITNFAAGNAGNYYAVASNIAGCATSTVANVTLVLPPTPPAIVAQPLSQTNSPGASVSFTVAAAGSPPLTYQWCKGGTLIAGAVSNTYTIASVSTTDAAQYSVVVFNPGGSTTSQPATLTVSLPGSAVTRQITRSGTNYLVSVTVVPPAGTPAYLAEEFIPANFTAVNISDSGSLDASDGRLAWGPFWDAVPRTLTYTLVPPSGFTGTATVNGSAFFFGATAATSGDNTISAIPTNPTTLGILQLPGPQYSQYFMITVNGTVGSSYRLDVAGDLAGPWKPLVILTLISSPGSYVDWEPAGQTQLFYRTVLLQ